MDIAVLMRFPRVILYSVFLDFKSSFFVKSHDNRIGLKFMLNGLDYTPGFPLSLFIFTFSSLSLIGYLHFLSKVFDVYLRVNCKILVNIWESYRPRIHIE